MSRRGARGQEGSGDTVFRRTRSTASSTVRPPNPVVSSSSRVRLLVMAPRCVAFRRGVVRGDLLRSLSARFLLRRRVHVPARVVEKPPNRECGASANAARSTTGRPDDANAPRGLCSHGGTCTFCLRRVATWAGDGSFSAGDALHALHLVRPFGLNSRFEIIGIDGAQQRRAP